MTPLARTGPKRLGSSSRRTRPIRLSSTISVAKSSRGARVPDTSRVSRPHIINRSRRSPDYRRPYTGIPIGFDKSSAPSSPPSFPRRRAVTAAAYRAGSPGSDWLKTHGRIPVRITPVCRRRSRDGPVYTVDGLRGHLTCKSNDVRIGRHSNLVRGKVPGTAASRGELSICSLIINVINCLSSKFQCLLTLNHNCEI